MSPQRPSSPPPAMPQESAIQQVLACFDAYARVHGTRDSILPASRVTPREEQRAFDELRHAIERLRDTTEED
ncbi:hypothetical protein AMK09_38115 [Streptomyces sp. CB02488]|uniref:hypothetical protein n=1 Tax=unclassified Streptomyces TaxID=2593676 RepID=UPI00093A0B9F|nr:MULTISPECIES: hypothetical protein [unclassified Streptomyces]OKK04248.1 hypothetical protein AMK09_38115 [Streptomyces sp. CB02488]